MEKVYTYYRENVTSYSRQAEQLKRQIHLLGTIRLILVALLILTIWLLRNESWQIILGSIVLFAIPFALLMVYHTRLHNRKLYTEALIALNESELKGLDYDFSAFDGAPEKVEAAHAFSLDLDVFGDRSLFQSLNRTTTLMGKERLSEWLLSPLTDKKEILRRQEAVRELKDHTSLRQHFYVTGKRRSGHKKDRDYLHTLTNVDAYFLHNRLWKALLWIVPAVWVVLLGGVIMGFLASSLLMGWICVSFIVANLTGKRINKIYESVNKMEKIFSTYASLMRSIESTPFHSEELTKIAADLIGKEGLPASKAIKQLSGYIGGLDQRYSAAGILLNLFYLRDTRHALCLERWKNRYRDEVVVWLDALGSFDAYSSLGGFAFNHPDYVYPEITDTYFRMEGKGLGHPLLNRDVCVRNDIHIPKKPWFLIITGANMAGKSTYLRTVGVNYLLACIGLPVFAESLTVCPAQMVTSLRTSDSLVSNESYFFAELKRLKMIIDRLKEGEELFIILDEILKGTNSVDKQKGSIALMKQLVHFETCGIIATHDLVLGTLEEEFPENIKNYRFEADIKNDELSFSYQLREGIAQNMNAYYLMKKMGITV